MHPKIQINKSKEGELNGTVASSFQELRERKITMRASRKSVKGLKEFNLMKHLASKIVYQRTDHSINNEATQTELTEKTEYRLHGSIYRLVRKTPKKKRKHYSISQMLKQNGSLIHYSNTCKMVNGNTTKLIRNKLTLHKDSKKIIKKIRPCRREKSLPDVLKSLEKLIRGINRNLESSEVVEEYLQWSLTSTYKSVIRQNEWNMLQIQPVPIVPPLPLPMWNSKALDETPMLVTLWRTPSLCKANRPHPFKSKVIMKGRSRKHKACMISAEALARALNPQRWNKGPRQVPVSTFRATRIPYRFLLAKYGKARLMGPRRVHQNVAKPTVHSNFSVINLLHEVEEAISQNKYSKETDRIVRNFKEELNKDLLFTEPINEKSHKHFAFNTCYSTTTKKKSKFTNQCSLSYLEHIETVCGSKINNFSPNRLDNDTESDFEIKSDITFEQKFPLKSKLDTKATTVLDSTGIKSFSNEHQIIDTFTKLNSKNENIEVSKHYNQKWSLIKDKINMKKKRILGRESKTEYLTEEGRLNAVIQELKKQVKISEPSTPLLLAKNDSLTEINFEQEPVTYINMPHSPSTTDTINNQLKESDLQLIDCILPDIPQLDQPESSSAIKELDDIKENKSKKKHSSTKGFTFRIDKECIKNKALNIFNILTAIHRVNKLLQNIPVQYDESGNQPYIVYDPKSIHKVVKRVNTKHESEMVVKINKKKKCENEETNSGIYEDNETNELQLKNIQDTTEINEEPDNLLNAVGNQLLDCILKSMKTELHSSESTESQTVVKCTESVSEVTKHEQIFDYENPINYKTDKHTLNQLNNIPSLTYASHSSNDPPENRIMIDSLTSKITLHLKKCYHQMKKIEINYQITRIYYQAITYMESKTYFVADHSVPQYMAEHSEILSNINTKEKEEKINKQCTNKSRYLESTKSNKNDYKQSFKINKNIPLELIKKYKKPPNNQNNRFTYSIQRKSTDDILKHYNQYNRTKKYIRTKNDFMRKYESQRNKSGNNHDDKIYKHSRNNQNDINQKDWQAYTHHTLNDNQQYNNINERKIKNQNTVCEKLTKPCNVVADNVEKSMAYESNKGKKALKGTETALIKKNTKPSPGIGNIENVLPNQYYAPNSTKNDTFKNEYSRNISNTASFMTNILRSASINTMQSTYPRGMDVTKQVFYFQITQPINPELLNIFKKHSTDEYFLPFINNKLRTKINYNKSGNLKTYKKNINEQVKDGINTIKEEMKENIENICRIANINRKLLIKFLKICLQKEEIHFDIETELNELKSEMKKEFGKQTYPLILVTRQEKRVKKELKIITFKNFQMSGKTRKQLVLKNAIDIKKSNEAISQKNLSFQILGFFYFLMFIFNLMTFFWIQF